MVFTGYIWYIWEWCFLEIGGVGIKYRKCKVCLCVCPYSAVECSIAYYGSMYNIMCICFQKHEIRRFGFRITGSISCLFGLTVRRLTTTFCLILFTFSLHPTKPRVLLTIPCHTTTTIMPGNTPHTRIVFTPTYICTYQHHQYTPKSKTRDTQQK